MDGPPGFAPPQRGQLGVIDVIGCGVVGGVPGTGFPVVAGPGGQIDDRVESVRHVVPALFLEIGKRPQVHEGGHQRPQSAKRYGGAGLADLVARPDLHRRGGESGGAEILGEPGFIRQAHRPEGQHRHRQNPVSLPVFHGV